MSAHDLPAELREVARQESWRYRVDGYTREDLEQEALAAMLAGLPAHDVSLGPLVAFGRLVARRHLISLLRRSTRELQAALNEAGRQPPDAHLDVSAPEYPTLEARELVRRIRQLPPLQRRTTIMFAAGFSYDEIATLDGVGRKTIDNRLFKARQSLSRAA